MASFLDDIVGLPALWAKIKAKFYTKAEVDSELKRVPHNIPYVLQTNTASAAALTGTTTELTELVDGQSIIFHFLYVSASSSTLNLTLADGTQTGAINVYYGGTTRLTSQCAAGNDYRLTYHKNIAVAGSGSYTGWWVEGNYDSNNYDRVRLNNAYIFSENATASSICGKSSTGDYIKIVSGSTIDITYPIAWLTTAVTITSSTTSANLYSQYISCTLRNNVASWTGTKGAMAYLYGTLSGTVLTVIGFTSTVPTSDDGYVYIPIGYLYSTYQVNFFCQNVVWWYKDGAFRPYSLYQDLSGYALSSNIYTKAEVDALIPEDEVMWVRITYDNESYTADKTFAEMIAHVDNGGTIIALDQFYERYQLIYADYEMDRIQFERTFAYNDYSTSPSDHYYNAIVSTTILINRSDEVTFTEDVITSAADSNPLMDGAAAVGTSIKYARADHVHPSDTSRLAVNQGTANAGKVLKVGSDGNVAAVKEVVTFGYDENTVGNAVVGEAVTGTPNYTPSGEVRLNTENISVPVELNYNWTNYKLYLTGITSSLITNSNSAEFIGNGVTFKYELEEE